MLIERESIRSRGLLPTISQWAPYLPPLVAVLVMLPRLLVPEFGLLDDGTTLIRAKEISDGVFNFEHDFAAGRSRPVYWLSYTLVYAIFGANPVWFFVANTLLLVVTVILLMRLVRLMGAGTLQTGLTGMLFVTTGPVIENYYTLSKGEPLQLLLLIGSILLVAPLRHEGSKARHVIFVLASTIAIVLAALTKETTLVIAPISLLWMLAGWLRRNRSQGRAAFRPRLGYLIASTLGVGSFLIIRSRVVTHGLTGGTYTNDYIFNPQQIILNALRWTDWLIRDYFYIVPLLVLGLVLFLRNQKIPQKALIVDALAWAAAWFAVYLPWAFIVEYYLLPLSAGLAVVSAVLLVEVYQWLLENRRAWRVAGNTLLTLALILWILTLVNNASNARIQIAVDSANAEMLDYVARQAEPGSTVLVNIQYANEYIVQVRLFLNQVYDRPDITVDRFKFQVSDIYEPGLEPQVIVAPVIKGQPALRVRMGGVEATQEIWNKTLVESLQENWSLVQATRETFRLFSVDLSRLLCPLVPTAYEYCSESDLVVDRRMFVYGWDIYKLELP